MTNAPLEKAREIYQKITANVEKVIRGQSEAVRMLMAAFVSGGHVLLEDVPGTGKTTLAKTLARSIDIGFKRVQFTPDLLPSDIVGVSIYNPKDETFQFHQGPIFTNILLADEINRASPRTQSALLEAMAEGQITADGRRYRLEDPFFVIATQNPVESSGTYPLPEAQMDRFALQFSLGYISLEEETALLTDQDQGHPLDAIGSCVGLEDVLLLKQAVKAVRISDELKTHVVKLVSETRRTSTLQLGASPRASLALMNTAKALALFAGFDYVRPEHIRDMAVPVIAHRLAIDPQARFSGQTPAGIVRDILHTIPAPA